MAQLVVLGSASAIPAPNHENTHLGLIGAERQILIDCVGNDLVRLPAAGMDLDKLSDIIVTHFHPDHASGLPLFLMGLWLKGRQAPLNLHGLAYTLERVQKLMAIFEKDLWPGFFELNYHEVPEEKLTPVLTTETFEIHASPTKHLLPTIGLRFEKRNTGKVIAYSCDTEFSENTIQLAQNADILIHEATGATMGHSSAEQAGKIAQLANVKALYFIHYKPERVDSPELIQAAQAHFEGPIQFAKDFMVLDF